MAANQNPIYALTPINTWGKVTAADTGTDGTGANVVLVLTAGSFGDFLNRLRFQPISTSGSTTTSAATARIYLNNGSSVASATNNILMYETNLIATVVNTSATVMALGIDFVLNSQLQAGYKVYVGVTAMAANTQWNIQSFCGDY